MIGKIGIDTSFLIDYFKGESNAIAFMENNSSSLVISELVIYEFLCGNLTQKEEKVFLEAVELFLEAPLSRQATQIASQNIENVKNGKSIGHQDCLIAGSYLASGVNAIVTANKKHFEHIKNITVLEY